MSGLIGTIDRPKPGSLRGGAVDADSADDLQVTPSRRRPQLALMFILVNVTLDSLAVTIVGPVMPALLKSLTGGAMAQMSTVFGTITVIFATMQLIAGPVQGALSDRFGRRPIVLISTIGIATYFVCLALTPSLTWVFVGVVIAGAAAGSVAAACRVRCRHLKTRATSRAVRSRLGGAQSRAARAVH